MNLPGDGEPSHTKSPAEQPAPDIPGDEVDDILTRIDEFNYIIEGSSPADPDLAYYNGVPSDLHTKVD